MFAGVIALEGFLEGSPIIFYPQKAECCFQYIFLNGYSYIEGSAKLASPR